jgi:hypothetical protein
MSVLDYLVHGSCKWLDARVDVDFQKVQGSGNECLAITGTQYTVGT